MRLFIILLISNINTVSIGQVLTNEYSLIVVKESIGYLTLSKTDSSVKNKNQLFLVTKRFINKPSFKKRSIITIVDFNHGIIKIKDTIFIIKSYFNPYNNFIGNSIYQYVVDINIKIEQNYYSINIDNIKCLEGKTVGNIGKEYFNTLDDLIEYYFPSGKTIHKTVEYSDILITFSEPLIQPINENYQNEVIVKLKTELEKIVNYYVKYINI